MKKRILLAIAVITIAFLISGCTPTNDTGGKDKTWFGGTNGLLISYIDENPPAEVFDTSDFSFDIVVNLENAGEYTIPAGQTRVTISGLHPGEFGTTAEALTKRADEIAGVKKDSEGNKIPGGIAQVEFTGLNHGGKLAGNIKYPVEAEVCYPYKTTANSQICLRRNLLRPTRGVCEVAGTKAVYSSGAPVQVSSVTESIAGSNKVQFVFNIKQTGNGNVYRIGTDCDPISFSNINRVKVSVSTVSGIYVKCTGLMDKESESVGYVRLPSGSTASVICTMETGNVDAATPVNIVLDYDYLDKKTTNIIVKHSAE